MQRLADNPEKRKGLQTIFICLFVSLMIVLGVGVGMYFLNQDNEVMPNASQSNPLDDKL